MFPALYLLFFLSGVSALIYQVIWVRQFGQVFGNTVHSASLVVGVFMLGLGAGSYLLGAWADRRHRTGESGLLGTYALLEGLIAALGLAISVGLPRIGGLVAGMSSYVEGANGWQALSTGSYLARAGLAVAMLTPITVLMGGTLTVLVRYAAHAGVRSAGWAIALLYGANTFGAAAGAFLTDFSLVPSLGLLGTQSVAVGLNIVAGLGALLLSRLGATAPVPAAASAPPPEDEPVGDAGAPALPLAAIALGLSGFAALGVEMLWLRHLGVMLGGFRAVFSLLLTVMLVALGAGALAGGWLDRRFGRPATLLMAVQGLFAVATLAGLALADAGALAVQAEALVLELRTATATSRQFIELWYNLRPMLLEVALPSFVAGCAFPLANAIVQRSEHAVGTRAGVLYAANTAGAVCGSVATGYVLLPWLGMQGTAGVLAVVAALAMVPLYLARERENADRRVLRVAQGSAVAACAALALWIAAPSDFLLRRALGPRDAAEQLLTVSEGSNELLAIVESVGRGRGLLTNGHAMSSTARLDQRYMRALAHIPLLAMEAPERVLVIGFGVGNTTHAASLHASVRTIEVADLSRNILEHAGYFAEANDDVLESPKVSVFVNDGRTHLQMAEPGAFDLIALEPPPIAHAGVASLYSREFYDLARSRLKDGGYVSQWLPAYQVPAESSLAMVRAFIDVFPQSVLLSGAQAELVLLGTTGPTIAIDPARIQAVLAAQPELRGDLEGVALGTPREIAATFVGARDTLVRATLSSPAAVDDRPVQEHGVLSRLTTSLLGVPSTLFELAALPSWCPGCYSGGEVAPAVAGLDLHMALMQQAYTAPVVQLMAAVGGAFEDRRILGSAYLGSVLPDSAEVHNVLGVAALREDRVDEAIVEFEAALARDPQSVNARANLGLIRFEQASAFMEARRFADAVPLLRVVVQLVPGDAEAQNDLGVALASLGNLAEAVDHFNLAVSIAPEFTEAQRNLDAARTAMAR